MAEVPDSLPAEEPRLLPPLLLERRQASCVLTAASVARAGALLAGAAALACIKTEPAAERAEMEAPTCKALEAQPFASMWPRVLVFGERSQL